MRVVGLSAQRLLHWRSKRRLSHERRLRHNAPEMINMWVWFTGCRYRLHLADLGVSHLAAQEGVNAHIHGDCSTPLVLSVRTSGAELSSPTFLHPPEHEPNPTSLWP